MLTPFRTIVAKKLHKDEIYTSIVLPKKIHDPHERIKAPHTSFICLAPNGRTYYRDVDHGTNTLNPDWVPTSKWIMESDKATAEDIEASAYRDSHWVKWSDVRALWKMKAEETQRVEQRKEGMKNAVITGAKLALANEAGDVAVNVIVDMVPAIAPHMDNPAARALAKLLGAFVLSHCADAAGAEHAPTVKATADLVATAASMELTQSQLKRLTPALEQLITLGKKIV